MNRERKTVLVDFSDPIDLAQTYLDSLRNLGLLHSGAPSLPLWSEITLECVLPEGARVQIPAQVVRVFSGPVHGLQLTATPETERLLARAREAAAVLQTRMLEAGHSGAVRLGGKRKAGDENTEDTVDDIKETTADLTPTQQVLDAAYQRFRRWINLHDRQEEPGMLHVPDIGELAEDMFAETDPAIQLETCRDKRADILRALPERQKKSMASSCDLQDRQLFLVDEDRSLQLWVLKNPGLTESEVLEISRRRDLTKEAVDFLLTAKVWCLKPRIARNLLLNPLTPARAIPRLLTLMPAGALRQLVRRGTTPAPIRDMAFDLLRERTD